MVILMNTQVGDYCVMQNWTRLELVQASSAWLLVVASMLNINKLRSHKTCIADEVNVQCTVWQVAMVTSMNTQPEDYCVMPNCMRLELVRARSGAWLSVAASMLNINKL